MAANAWVCRLKPREPRRKALIKARMRVGATWRDVCILDISPRGLGLQAASPPDKGGYIEVRRGRHVIVARVVWTNKHRFGVRAQDRLPIEQIIAEPDKSQAPSASVTEIVADRRSAPRPASVRHEQSRMASRTMEFAWFAVIGISVATIAFGAVEERLGRPISRISTALAAN